MKKIIFAITLVAAAMLMAGCNSCTAIAKNLESDLGELNRDIVVLNAFRGDTLFKYSGPCYISNDSANNSVTLLYYEGGKPKKADWLGDGFIFQAIEK